MRKDSIKTSIALGIPGSSYKATFYDQDEISKFLGFNQSKLVIDPETDLGYLLMKSPLETTNLVADDFKKRFDYVRREITKVFSSSLLEKSFLNEDWRLILAVNNQEKTSFELKRDLDNLSSDYHYWVSQQPEKTILSIKAKTFQKLSEIVPNAIDNFVI